MTPNRRASLAQLPDGEGVRFGNIGEGFARCGGTKACYVDVVLDGKRNAVQRQLLAAACSLKPGQRVELLLQLFRRGNADPGGVLFQAGQALLFQ